jgi:hypothetical protein
VASLGATILFAEIISLEHNGWFISLDEKVKVIVGGVVVG